MTCSVLDRSVGYSFKFNPLIGYLVKSVYQITWDISLKEHQLSAHHVNYSLSSLLFCWRWWLEFSYTAGGPVFTKKNGNWVQIGLVSWGPTEITETSYDVNTDVLYFKDWIVTHKDRLVRQCQVNLFHWHMAFKVNRNYWASKIKIVLFASIVIFIDLSCNDLLSMNIQAWPPFNSNQRSNIVPICSAFKEYVTSLTAADSAKTVVIEKLRNFLYKTIKVVPTTDTKYTKISKFWFNNAIYLSIPYLTFIGRSEISHICRPSFYLTSLLVYQLPVNVKLKTPTAIKSGTMKPNDFLIIYDGDDPLLNTMLAQLTGTLSEKTFLATTTKVSPDLQSVQC